MERKDKENIFKSLKYMTTEYDGFRMVFLKVANSALSLKTIKRVFLICILSLFSLPLINHISISENTYKYVEILVNSTDTLMLGLFAITFTGYALFQALTSGHTLISFLKERTKNMSKFEEFNLSFFSLTLGYLFIISINYILKISLPIIVDFKLLNFLGSFKNNIVNISIYFYFVFNIFLLLEMRSFIFNLFQCFNVNAISHGIKYLKDDKKD